MGNSPHAPRRLKEECDVLEEMQKDPQKVRRLVIIPEKKETILVVIDIIKSSGAYVHYDSGPPEHIKFDADYKKAKAIRSKAWCTNMSFEKYVDLNPNKGT